MRCWGWNAYNQLGNGNAVQVNSPPTTAVLTNAIAVCAGAAHSCALNSTGYVKCWGYNADGGATPLPYHVQLPRVRYARFAH